MYIFWESIKIMIESPLISLCRLITKPIYKDGFIKCPRGQVFQLSYQGEIIGGVVGVLRESVFHILCLEVLPAYRHQGFGRCFIRLLEEYLVNLGVTLLEADEVEPDDAPFWTKSGFHLVETKGQDSLTFQKNIRIIEEASS
jgi:ribosomal protein S18 acetylase RimI-like enzyme